MRELFPEPRQVDAPELLAEMRLGDRAPADRPYTIVNFVSSVDGHATVDGRSGPLGDVGDREIFRALRGCADAVMAGTGTLRAERYGALIKRPETFALRERLGLSPQPIACTITRTGALPDDIPLLHEPSARVVIYSGAELRLDGARASVEVVRIDPERLTPAAALADLRARHGVRLLLCEGGPKLFAAMVAERVADELFLSLSATLAGGAGPAITDALALPEPRSLQLQWALEQAGSLYLRYALRN